MTEDGDVKPYYGFLRNNKNQTNGTRPNKNIIDKF